VWVLSILGKNRQVAENDRRLSLDSPPADRNLSMAARSGPGFKGCSTMCELLGMSANVPTDICFSFSGLAERGGRAGPHQDGWGIAFYEGKGCRTFHDPEASADSEIARLIRDYPIRSCNVISHIRRANRGKVCLENTHPFTRELWGRNWTFAHNGELKGIKKYPLTHYRPVGTTDSEHAFCWLMDAYSSETCHPFHVKAATQTGAKLPPVGA
jgi:predicted glutamine amidotransferase